MHICHEILTDLSYEEVEGIIAVALAEKVTNKSTKLALIGVSSFTATVTAVYLLSKHYKFSVSEFIFGSHRYRSSIRDRQDSFESSIWLMLMPALLTVKVASNNVQKQVDIQAAQLTAYVNR